MSGALWNEKNANAIANRRTIQGARRSMIRESLSRQTGRYVFTDGSSVAGSAKSSSNPHFGDLLYMAPTRENMDVTAMVKSLRVGTQDEPEGTQRSRASQEWRQADSSTARRPESTLTERCEALSVRSAWPTERITDALTKLEGEKAAIEATLARLDAVIEAEETRKESCKRILQGGRGTAQAAYMDLQRRQCDTFLQ